jgi:hypothetical protein
LVTIASLIAVRYIRSGEILNLVVYPQDIDSGLLRISDAIGVWTALVMGVLLVVLYRLLSELAMAENRPRDFGQLCRPAERGGRLNLFLTLITISI